MAADQALLINLFAIVLADSVLWGLSLLRRDASIVDIFGGLGFVLLEDSLRSRVTGYAEYIRDTGAFFPLPPMPINR